MRECGSWLATARSRRLPPKPQACIVCSELASDRVNLGLPDSARLPGPPLAALAGTSLTILSAIYRKCGSQDLLAGDGLAEDSRG